MSENRCDGRRPLAAHHRHPKVQVPGVGLGAAGKRCGGNARRELQGSGFRANETAERFHADCAYGQNFAARTLAATRSSMGDVNELLSMRTDVSRGGEAVGSFLYPIEKNRVVKYGFRAWPHYIRVWTLHSRTINRKAYTRFNTLLGIHGSRGAFL